MKENERKKSPEKRCSENVWEGDNGTKGGGR